MCFLLLSVFINCSVQAKAESVDYMLCMEPMAHRYSSLSHTKCHSQQTKAEWLGMDECSHAEVQQDFIHPCHPREYYSQLLT